MKNLNFGLLQIAFGALLFGLQPYFVRSGGSDPFFAGTLRCLGLTLILYGFVGVRPNWSALRGTNLVIALSAAVCNFAFPAGFAYTDAATAISIAYAGVLFCPVIDLIWTGKKITGYDLLLLLLAAIGVGIIASQMGSSGRSSTLGVIASCSAAIAWATFASGQRVVGHKVNLILEGNLIGLTFGFIFLTASNTSMAGALSYAGNGLTASLAFLLFSWGMRTTDAVRTSVVSTLEVPVAISVMILCFNEWPTYAQGGGAALIVLANILAARSTKEGG